MTWSLGRAAPFSSLYWKTVFLQEQSTAATRIFCWPLSEVCFVATKCHKIDLMNNNNLQSFSDYSQTGIAFMWMPQASRLRVEERCQTVLHAMERAPRWAVEDPVISARMPRFQFWAGFAQKTPASSCSSNGDFPLIKHHFTSSQKHAENTAASFFLLFFSFSWLCVFRWSLVLVMKHRNS